MKKDKYTNFTHLQRYSSEHMDILCRKIYPYEWMDGINKMKHKGLPPIEALYNRLHQKGPSQEEYAHATNVYNSLICEVFDDCCITYLEM